MLQLDFKSLEIVKLVKADLNTLELFTLKIILVWLLNFVALNCAFFNGFLLQELDFWVGLSAVRYLYYTYILELGSHL